MSINEPTPRPSGRGRYLSFALAAPLLLIAIGLAVGPGLSAAPESRPVLVSSGGGEYKIEHADEITPEQREQIRADIDANIARLEAQGALPRARTAVTLGWPLQPSPGFTDPGYHSVSGFVDHNPAYPGQRLDYTCGERTYDTSGGYNHAGTDYYIWPFSWNKMAAGAVQVVAAAPGTIVLREDGHPDQSCSFNSNRWNAVYIRQADGSIAWYGHLKLGSVTGKQVGETVQAGEYLGLVGSSGNSTGPHLHFELHDANWNLIDPYAGSCNASTPATWWAVQRPYRDSAVIKLMTGSDAVDWQSCPQPDITHETQWFQPGQTVYFTTFYRDQLNTQPSAYRIYRPDGGIYTQWNHTSSAAAYNLSYWWWEFAFGTDVPTGTWRFEVTFEGKTYSTTFYIGQPSTATPGVTATPRVEPTATAVPSATPILTPTYFSYWSFIPVAQGGEE